MKDFVLFFLVVFLGGGFGFCFVWEVQPRFFWGKQAGRKKK